MLQEFKKFALRGSVIDLAVGIIIGAAFNSVVQSLVNDIIMPPIGLATGNLNFNNLMWVIKDGNPAGPYATPTDAASASAVTLNYGQFVNTVITFIIIAFAVFLLIRAINRLYVQKETEEAPVQPVVKECPFCFKEIPIEATRCPFCTSQLEKKALT
jgi:large conductance mechanosensitive channel